MPGCSAVNCSLQSSKGYRLFRFPASPRRRAKWIQFTRRAKWTPTAGSRLCEVHFEPSQYETFSLKEGETPKLRRTSVPTLFGIPKHPKRSDPKKRSRKRTISEVQPGDSETYSDQLVGPVQYYSEHNYFKKKEKDPLHIPVPVTSPDREFEMVFAVKLEPLEEDADDQQFTNADKNIGSDNELRPNCLGGIDAHDLNRWISQDEEPEVFADPLFEPHGKATTCSLSLDYNLEDTPSSNQPDDSNLIKNEPSLNVQNDHIANTHSTRSGQQTLTEKCLQQHIWRLQKQVARLKKENQEIRSAVNSRFGFLSAEQMRYLLSGKKNREYSPEMIRDAIQIRDAVGTKGYKYLVQKGFPLPCNSTICRKMQMNDLSPGLPS